MKRTLAEHVAFLMLSAALAVGAWAVTGRAACSVTAPYQFPVQPGTPEWVELSANARRAACRLPAGLAEQMTSEALLETALDYPFNASMYVSSDLEGMFGKRAALAGNGAVQDGGRLRCHRGRPRPVRRPSRKAWMAVNSRAFS